MERSELWLEFDRQAGLVSVKWPRPGGEPGGYGPRPWREAIEFARAGVGSGVYHVEVRVTGSVRLPNSRRAVTDVVNRYWIQLRGSS